MRILCLGLILCVAAGTVAAADKNEKKKDAPKPVEAGRVYTQADLERVIQASKDAPTTPLPPADSRTTTLPPAQPPAKPAKAPAAKEAPLAFSNDDLERMYGKVEEKPAPEPDANLPKLPDPVAEVSDWQAQRAAAERRRDEATVRVQQLEGQIRDLEQREAAVRNPLLPRPAAPAGLEGGWDKLSGVEKVTALDARLAAVREQLAKARQDAVSAQAAVQAAGAEKPAD